MRFGPRPLPINNSGMLLESWAAAWQTEDSPSSQEHGKSIILHGNMRAYLARKPSSESWSGSTYDKLRLLGKTLTWTVDLSRVGCGCNAALYLVSMTQPDSTGSR